ncbi:hypothetical protein H6503_05320 [Candidatus Woesearchaeota archaeon]|nr:hypothetical protein [Candidatus Woesearchaeota archaeon]
MRICIKDPRKFFARSTYAILIILAMTLIVLWPKPAPIEYDKYFEDSVLLDKTTIDENIKNSPDGFERGKNLVVLARKYSDDGRYLDACEEFLSYKTLLPLEQALLYEIVGSLNCNDKQDYYYELAAESWLLEDVQWRHDLLKNIDDYVPNFPTIYGVSSETLVSKPSEGTLLAFNYYDDEWYIPNTSGAFIHPVEVNFPPTTMYLREDIVVIN